MTYGMHRPGGFLKKTSLSPSNIRDVLPEADE